MWCVIPIKLTQTIASICCDILKFLRSYRSFPEAHLYNLKKCSNYFILIVSLNNISNECSFIYQILCQIEKYFLKYINL